MMELESSPYKGPALLWHPGGMGAQEWIMVCMCQAIPEWQVVCEQQKMTGNSYRGDRGHGGWMMSAVCC